MNLPRLTRSVSTESGETLVEVIISMLVISIVFVALMAGFGTSIGISAIHKQQATAQAIGRDFAEYLQYYDAAHNEGSKYHPCGTVSDYSDALANFVSSYSLPNPGGNPLTGPDKTFTVAVTEVAYWNGDTNNAQFVGTCPSPDQGTQRLTFTVTSVHYAVVERLQVVKRQ